MEKITFETWVRMQLENPGLDVVAQLTKEVYKNKGDNNVDRSNRIDGVRERHVLQDIEK